jgi:hypothetical protein
MVLCRDDLNRISTKILRRRCDGDGNYGSHTVYGVASFSWVVELAHAESPRIFAALVTAFFPSDQRLHRITSTISGSQSSPLRLLSTKQLCCRRRLTGESVSVSGRVRGSTLEVQRFDPSLVYS